MYQYGLPLLPIKSSLLVLLGTKVNGGPLLNKRPKISRLIISQFFLTRKLNISHLNYCLLITFANNLNPDQNLGHKCLTL